MELPIPELNNVGAAVTVSLTEVPADDIAALVSSAITDEEAVGVAVSDSVAPVALVVAEVDAAVSTVLLRLVSTVVPVPLADAEMAPSRYCNIAEGSRRQTCYR